MLHDIGKLGIPTEILHAPRALTEEERIVMEQHPVIGERILQGIPYLEEVARAVRHEHERWDGTGYPDGLAGEAIPLASRVVFACDAWHAMTSDRPYRKALPEDVARAELAANAGTQFDPARCRRCWRSWRAPRRAAPAVRASPVDAESRGAPPRPAAGLRGRADRRRGPVRVPADLARGATRTWTAPAAAPDGPATWSWTPSTSRRSPGRCVAGEPVCLGHDDEGRVFGPYYARTAALVPHGPEPWWCWAPPATIWPACAPRTWSPRPRVRSEASRSVPPAKRLADELEVLEAVRAVTAIHARPWRTRCTRWPR